LRSGIQIGQTDAGEERMNSQVATRLEERTARPPLRPLAIQALGAVTVLVGLVWALIQPYRVTLLHPYGKGVWDLLVEPPLLVVVVGLLFALLVAPGLLRDLEADAATR